MVSINKFAFLGEVRITHPSNRPNVIDDGIALISNVLYECLEHSVTPLSSSYVAFGSLADIRNPFVLVYDAQNDLLTILQCSNHSQQGSIESIAVVVDAYGVYIDCPDSFSRCNT